MPDGATLPELPVEVTENVLDQLRGDSRTLAVCCRVGRDWYPRARYNLYHTVHLDVDNIGKFFKAVTQDPALAELMRDFSLNGLWKSPSTPPDVLRTTNLKILRLNFIDTRNYWLPTLISYATNSVTELSLTHCFTEDVRSLMHFLRTFPHLKHFAAAEMRIQMQPDEETLADIPEFPALRSLCLSGFGGLPLRLVNTFVGIEGALSHLSVLKIKLSMGELARFSQVLVLISDDLGELELMVEPDDTALGPESTPLSLSSCPKLSFLTIDFRLLHPKPISHPDHLAWIPRLLSSVRSKGLRDVKLVMRASGARTKQDIDVFPWAKVARALRAKRFAALRRVVVRIVRGGGMRRFAVAYVKEKLAAVERRGILRCVQTGGSS
ncbi:hypothetical protein C8Q70DRAFT_930622 [Cubamyces menziesii]|nr:hypothetical protein C8Q70DRAFT_930622 [Cubamyces menziesii]